MWVRRHNPRHRNLTDVRIRDVERTRATGLAGPLSRESGFSQVQESPAFEEQVSLIAPHSLRLSRPDGETIEVPATNYYLEKDGSHRAPVADLASVIMKRSPAEQARLATKITAAHADAEMSFRVKDPETGFYDKVFKVPCHPNPVPLEKKHYDMLVESTGSVMRALREVLQKLYSNPNATVAELGLDAVPKEEQERLLATIRGSIYFEPRLVDPAMAEYPFLTVGGFDAAVGDLDNPDPVFFEFNLGTPSGLSNNVQLQEALRKLDPEVFATIRDRLPEDDTFQCLRRAVESNALAWTGKPHGVSVVLSPGVANGAHPDVASIAHYSGMPLVNPSDLYQDANGEVRLNTGNGEPHPVVTGIYGRMEESYFLQDSREGVPIRDPHLEDNEALSEKLGVKLEPGIVYEFIYDEDDEIVGVKKDDQGRPRLQPVFESIGRDPARPDAEPGSFLNAIKSRNLYYSGLGGRVVDDKRVFQAISRHVAPRYVRRPDEPIARPPRTLDPAEYDQFYESEHLERFVVKAPDRSGGDGVMLLCNLSEAKRRQVVEEVQADPSHFIVQEMVPSAVMLSPERSEGGEMAYGSFMTDWRIFSMMDADGEVTAGPNSLLLRVANSASASTNTSQGGGYGIGVILDDPGTKFRKKDESLLPPAPGHRHLSAGKANDLRSWLELFNMVTDWSDPNVGGEFLRNGNATMLADRQRAVMELLGRDFAPVMSLLRDYDQGEVEAEEVHLALLDLRDRLMSHEGFPVEGVKEVLRTELSKYEPFEVTVRSGPKPPSRRELLDLLQVQPVEGTVYGSATPEIDDAISRLERFGGELRFTDEAPYFRVEDARPVVGVDLTKPYGLAALAHQMAYLEVWEGITDALAHRGLSREQAAIEAGARMRDSTVWLRAERRGIEAEIAVESSNDSLLNRGTTSGPRSEHEAGYANRITHPEVETLRNLFFREKVFQEPFDEREAVGFLSRIIHVTERATAKRKKHLDQRIDVLSRTHNDTSRTERLRLKASRSALEQKSLFERCFDPAAVMRFEADGTLDRLQRLFATGVRQAKRPGADRRSPKARFKAPDAVLNGRDALDDARERPVPFGIAGRVIMAGATLATGVAGSAHILGGVPDIEEHVERHDQRLIGGGGQ